MKVLIADGCPEVTDCLVVMMQEIPHVEFLSPTRDAEATLASIRRYDPEVVIVDATLPGARSNDFLQSVRSANPDATLIILIDMDYVEYYQRSNGKGDEIFMDRSREFVLLSEFSSFSGQNCSVWVKFSCGEFRVLDCPVDRGLQVLDEVVNVSGPRYVN